MNSNLSMHERIETKLQSVFDPDDLQVEDQSEQHIGHAGYKEGGGTHFAVIIQASAFNGKSRIQQQRMIYAELKSEFEDGLHALSLTVMAGTG